MNRLRTLLLACSVSVAVAAQTPLSHAPSLAFVHVTVVDGTGAAPLEDSTVIVTGNVITAIGRTGRIGIPDGARVVNGTGKFLIPGLWDMHTHGLNTAEFLPFFIANGITGVRFMGGAGYEQAKQIRNAIQDGSLLGPRVVMVAPVVDGSKAIRAFARVITTASEAREAVDSLRIQGDFLKVLDTFPRDAYFAFADEARRENVPFVGHLPITVTAAEASDAGQRCIEHMNGILRSCAGREAELRADLSEAITKPGVNVGDLLFYRSGISSSAVVESYDSEKAENLFARFRKNGTWVCPTLVDHRAFAYPEEFAADARLKYIARSRVAAWNADARRTVLTAEVVAGQRKVFQKYLEVVGAMHRARVDLLAGTDFGLPYVLPGFGLHDELGLLVEAGLTPMEALQSATSKATAFLGLAASVGTVHNGKLADIIVLDANPLDDIRNVRKVRSVVVNGKLISRTELDSMLSKAELSAR